MSGSAPAGSVAAIVDHGASSRLLSKLWFGHLAAQGAGSVSGLPGTHWPLLLMVLSLTESFT